MFARKLNARRCLKRRVDVIAESLRAEAGRDEAEDPDSQSSMQMTALSAGVRHMWLVNMPAHHPASSISVTKRLDALAHLEHFALVACGVCGPST